MENSDYNFITSYTVIPEYNIGNSTEELMESDVVEENLDEWSIDDYFINLPPTIERYDGTICGFRLEYSVEWRKWYACYMTSWGDRILETDMNETQLETLKELYLNIKNYVE